MNIVAITGFGREQDRQRAAEAGFDHFARKPPEPVLLRQLFLKGRTATPTAS